MGLSVPPLKKKQKSQHNEFIVQEQGMGGTVYDRDTIMKKYMNGYDGKTLGHKHITLLLQRHGIVIALVGLYMQPQPGCQILLITELVCQLPKCRPVT